MCGWHAHHEATRRELDRLRARREAVVLAAHSVAEAYSVLTRLPEPHRLRPEDALALIEANWSASRVVALSAADVWRVLRKCRDLQIAGGAVSDALIAASAQKARVSTVLTWDVSVFERFLGDQPMVTTPGA
jgi:predicted nucleic acid-binding protein